MVRFRSCRLRPHLPVRRPSGRIPCRCVVLPTSLLCLPTRFLVLYMFCSVLLELSSCMPQALRWAMCFATTYESTSNITDVSPALVALRMPVFNPSYSATLFEARPIEALNHAGGSPLSPVLHAAVPYPALPTLSPCSRRLAPSDLYRTARPIGLGGSILRFLLSFLVF